MRSPDTSPEAAKVRTRILREMTGSERLRLALDLSATTRRLALSGLRARDPDATDEELVLALIRLCYGDVPGVPADR